MIIVCPPYAYPMQHHQTVRVHVGTRASINWPDAWKTPERPEPEHPSHEDPSPVYLGVASTANVTNASGHLILSDSGALGNLNTTVPTTWLQVGPYTVEATHDLYFGER